MKPRSSEEVLVALAHRGWVRARVADVARAAGVSEASARHVIAGRVERVSHELAARIYRAIGLGEAAEV